MTVASNEQDDENVEHLSDIDQNAAESSSHESENLPAPETTLPESDVNDELIIDTPTPTPSADTSGDDNEVDLETVSKPQEERQSARVDFAGEIQRSESNLEVDLEFEEAPAVSDSDIDDGEITKNDETGAKETDASKNIEVIDQKSIEEDLEDSKIEAAENEESHSNSKDNDNQKESLDDDGLDESPGDDYSDENRGEDDGDKDLKDKFNRLFRAGKYQKLTKFFEIFNSLEDKEKQEIMKMEGSVYSDESGCRISDKLVHLAARVGNKDIMQALVENGGDLFEKNTEKRTPLVLAIGHYSWNELEKNPFEQTPFDDLFEYILEKQGYADLDMETITLAQRTFCFPVLKYVLAHERQFKIPLQLASNKNDPYSFTWEYDAGRKDDLLFCAALGRFDKMDKSTKEVEVSFEWKTEGKQEVEFVIAHDGKAVARDSPPPKNDARLVMNFTAEPNKCYKLYRRVRGGRKLHFKSLEVKILQTDVPEKMFLKPALKPMSEVDIFFIDQMDDAEIWSDETDEPHIDERDESWRHGIVLGKLGKGEKSDIVRLSFDWRDQGWGNRKGEICVVAHETEEPIDDNIDVTPMEETEESAPHEYGSTEVKFEAEGSKYYSLYFKVARGGGHELLFRNCKIQVSDACQWIHGRHRQLNRLLIRYVVNQCDIDPAPYLEDEISKGNWDLVRFLACKSKTVPEISIQDAKVKRMLEIIKEVDNAMPAEASKNGKEFLRACAVGEYVQYVLKEQEVSSLKEQKLATSNEKQPATQKSKSFLKLRMIEKSKLGKMTPLHIASFYRPIFTADDTNKNISWLLECDPSLIFTKNAKMQKPLDVAQNDDVKDFLKMKMTGDRSPQLFGDHAKGEDNLLLKDEAEALADTIAYKDLEAPFVVGLLGRWGSGKSHLFSLMKDRLAQIQEQKVTETNDFSFAGHIYLIKFDAWTYAKGNMWASFMYTILSELNKQLHLEAELSKPQPETEEQVHDTVSKPETEIETKTCFRNLFETTLKCWSVLYTKLMPGTLLNGQGETAASKICRIVLIFLGCMIFLLVSIVPALFCAIFLVASIIQATIVEKVLGYVNGMLEGLVSLANNLNPTMYFPSDDDGVVTNEGIEQIAVGGTKDKDIAGNDEPALRSETADMKEDDKRNSQKKDQNYEVLKQGISVIKIRYNDKKEREKYLKKWKNKKENEFDYNEERCSKIIDLDIPNVTDELAKAGNANYNKDIRDFQGLSNIKRWRDQAGDFQFDDALNAIKDAHESTDDEPDPGGIEAFEQLTPLHKLKLIFSPRFVKKIKGISIPFLLAAAMAVLWVVFDDWWSEKIVPLVASVLAPIATLVPIVMKNLKDISATLESKSTKFENNFKDSSHYVSHIFNKDSKNDAENPTPALDEGVKELKEKVWVRRGKGLKEIVKDRVEANSYESDLGTVHQAQQDLMRLSHSMLSRGEGSEVSSSGEENMFPRGKPRIVLFIDDIDRCPPDQVVDVLEALQLLVKTKLFVVLIALDTQYVTLALEEKYQLLDKTNGWHPSGTDYIEKILQISYRLAPIERPTAVEKYVISQMESKTKKKDKNSKPPQGGSSEDQKSRGINHGSRSQGSERLDSTTEPKNTLKQQDKSHQIDAENNNNTQSGDHKVIDKQVDQPVESRRSQTAAQENQEIEEAEKNEQLTVMLKEIQFEDYEKNIVMKAAESTTLYPRSLKRVMNVVKILKFLWHRQSRKRAKKKAEAQAEKQGRERAAKKVQDSTAVFEAEFSEQDRRRLREASICLLVVCAASNLPIRERIARFYSRYELMVVGNDHIGNVRNLRDLIIHNGFGPLNCEYTRPMQFIFDIFATVCWCDGEADGEFKRNESKWLEVKDVLRLVRAFSIIPEMNIEDYDLSTERSRANRREERKSLMTDIKSLRELMNVDADGSKLEENLRISLQREVLMKEKKVLQLSQEMFATEISTLGTEVEGIWYSDNFYGVDHREWIEISIRMVESSNNRGNEAAILEAVKVVGDRWIPSGFVTWKTSSWPTIGGPSVPIKLQGRSDPENPEGFKWFPGELTLVSEWEIQVEYSGETGTFFKRETPRELKRLWLQRRNEPENQVEILDE